MIVKTKFTCSNVLQVFLRTIHSQVFYFDIHELHEILEIDKVLPDVTKYEDP